MAKSNSIKIRLNSTADTGFFYVAKKNPRTMTDKLEVKKYDPVARKHVLFKEGKIKSGDVICLAAFGSGFTWASALIRW